MLFVTVKAVFSLASDGWSYGNRVRLRLKRDILAKMEFSPIIRKSSRWTPDFSRRSMGLQAAVQFPP